MNADLLDQVVVRSRPFHEAMTGGRGSLQMRFGLVVLAAMIVGGVALWVLRTPVSPVTQRLVELMGGSVHVTSTLGKGSEFCVEMIRSDMPLQSGAEVYKAKNEVS